MKRLEQIPRSVLDLSPIPAGGDAAEALRRSLDLARHAEALGYHRYWVAEHHNMTGIASAATAVVIGHLAAGTKKIRVGSGGIMLPNHAPLVIAEQFGTLESLFPGRIDLGLGRAPGGDQPAARALRKHLDQSGDDFPRLLDELRGYFRAAAPGQILRAVPGAGLDVPIWLLSSSGFSARLAGLLGLPFAFAGQFAPRALEEAFALYRDAFRPSEKMPEPHAALGVNIIAADTDAVAQRLATSHQQAFLNLIRGRPGPLPAPVDSMDDLWTPPERAAVEDMLSASLIGGPATVRRGIHDLLTRTGADELIINAAIFDQAARRRSYEIVAQLWTDADDEL
jgi:luciferase family oxidoreductase group 1